MTNSSHRKMRLLHVALGAVALTTASAAPASYAGKARGNAAVAAKKRRLQEQASPIGSYIVRFAPPGTRGASVGSSTTTAAALSVLDTLHLRTSDDTQSTFLANIYLNMTGGHAFNGFAAELSTSALEYLYTSSAVASIEPDVVLHFVQTATPPAATPSPEPSPAFTQNDAEWQLDRIDQRSDHLDDKFRYTNTGQGVDLYVVDSGINTEHVEFTGRIGPGINFSPEGDSANVEDCNGHGTHVSGLAAGSTFGVAKEATIIPVRVYGCSNEGPLSTTLLALNWVATSVASRGRRAVVNMSFGGARSQALDDAVTALWGAGAVPVVAAGNEASDACSTSPAGAPVAMTVASMSEGDTFSSFSNFGSCVDIMAPGEDIRSAWIGSPRATARLSGTSMATPVVSGVAAAFLQANPSASSGTVIDRLKCSGTVDAISRMPDRATPNLLVYAPPGGFPPNADCVISSAFSVSTSLGALMTLLISMAMLLR